MNPIKITSSELARRLAESNPLLLLDVRLSEDFASVHLPGAKNNCVFEITFLERINLADRQSPICVYGGRQQLRVAYGR